MPIALGPGIGVPYGGTPPNFAQQLLNKLGDSFGLAIDFATDQSMVVADNVTPTNNYSSQGIVSSSGTLLGPGGLLSYSSNSPSPKLCLQSTGFLQYGPHNLIGNSAGYNLWASSHFKAFGSGSVLNSGATLDPNGGNAAAFILPDSSAGSTNHFIQMSGYSGGLNAAGAIYVKQGGYYKVALRESQVVGAWVCFDINAGTVFDSWSSGGVTITGTIVPAANGFYKITATATGNTTGTAIPTYNIVVLDNAFAAGSVHADIQSYNYTADGTSGIYIYHGQVYNTPISDASYLATTSASVFALPYEFNSSGVCQGIKDESQRTNQLTYSTDFTNAAYTKHNATVALSGTSPNGVANSFNQIVEDGTTNAHCVYGTGYGISSNGVTYCTSLYVAPGTRRYVSLRGEESAANTWAWITFDTTNGTINANASVTNSGVIALPNGAYRIWMTWLGDGAGSGYIVVAGSNVSTAPAQGSAFGNSYAGDGVSYINVWGLQTEVGTYPSSLIVTGSASVIRAADNIGVLISKFPFSTTVGTYYCKVTIGSGNITGSNRIIGMDGAGDYAPLFASSNTVGGSYNSTGTFTATAGSGGFSTGAKLAFAHDATPLYGVCMNNGTVTSAAGAVTFSGNTNMLIGNGTSGTNNDAGYIQQIAYWPRKFSSGQLQTITT